MSLFLRKRHLNLLSIIIPVYENQESLPSLFKELMKLETHFKTRKTNLEFIFVNDGSKDDSLKILLEAKKSKVNWMVVDLSRNFGAVNCSRVGFDFVSGDDVVETHTHIEEENIILKKENVEVEIDIKITTTETNTLENEKEIDDENEEEFEFEEI